MKKLLFMFIAASAFTFASCDSKKENAVEENAEMKEEATEDGYESLHEVQVIERRLLESLSAIVVDLRALVSKKQEAIADMDYYDQSSNWMVV